MSAEISQLQSFFTVLNCVSSWSKSSLQDVKFSQFDCNSSSSSNLYLTDLIWVTGVVVRDDVSHEGAVFDVLLITRHVDGVFSGFCRQIADVTRPVVLVLALDFSLRRSLDGKTWNTAGQIR